jgi:hypothetical protein
VVQFKPNKPANRYRSGDYWLIPVRIAANSILWPRVGGKLTAVAPHGIQHHYAPLGIVGLVDDQLATQADCRPKFKVPVAMGF